MPTELKPKQFKLTPADLEAIAAIREHWNFATDTTAVRFALTELRKQIPADRPARKARG